MLTRAFNTSGEFRQRKLVVPRISLWLSLLMLLASPRADAQLGYTNVAEIGLGGAETGYSTAGLIEGPDGTLFGVTSRALFKVHKEGTGFRLLHRFEVLPNDGINTSYGTPQWGTNGLLYGVTRSGGTNGTGTIYRIRPDGFDYRVLFSFGHPTNTGATPTCQLIVGDDGALYGTTRDRACIFRIEHDGSGFRVINAEPWNPPLSGDAHRSGVIKGSDGMLYGAATSGGLPNPKPGLAEINFGMGTIYRMRQDGTGYETLYRFQGVEMGDGANPRATLCEASDGRLYGTTVAGGVYATPITSFYDTLGTVFRIHRDGSGYEVLHRFQQEGQNTYVGAPQCALIEGSDGAMYGTARGRVFKIQKDGSAFNWIATNSYDYLEAGLLRASDGFLYGASDAVYRLREDGSDHQKLVQFRSLEPEAGARSPLHRTPGGLLLGVTDSGGPTNAGTVFTLGTNGTEFRVISLLGTNTSIGRTPVGVAQGRDKLIYVVTQFGGSNNAGVLFRMDEHGRSVESLHHFGGVGDGRFPRAGPISGGDGYLYGCTYQGGTSGRGVIFRISEANGGYVILRHFGSSPPDGQAVQAPLVLGLDGALYGVASSGGASNRGTIFRIHPDGTGFSNVHHFTGGTDGANPQTALLPGTDGAFYGTTFAGGYGYGTVYRILPTGAEYQTLHRFDHALEGRYSRGGLIESPPGILWGCASAGGANNGGLVFRLRRDGTAFRVMWDFGTAPGDGYSPMGGLISGLDGMAYGTTSGGGLLGLGTVFRFDPWAVVLRIERLGENISMSWEGGATADQVEALSSWNFGVPEWTPLEIPIQSNGDQREALIPLAPGQGGLFRIRRAEQQ